MILRSGCYLTQDWSAYASLPADVHRRTRSAEPGLEPDLEVWARVLSLPEPGLVIVSAVRRDFGQDAGNPRRAHPYPLRLCGAPAAAKAGWQMDAVSD